MYLSYLMGAKNISDDELIALGILFEKTSDGDRKLKIQESEIENYRKLIIKKLDNGFWNEFIGEKEIRFIFKLENGELKEYVLSPENEQEIDNLCAKLNNEPPGKTANVYKYISENSFYHDFMLKHYNDKITRQTKEDQI